MIRQMEDVCVFMCICVSLWERGELFPFTDDVADQMPAKLIIELLLVRGELRSNTLIYSNVCSVVLSCH